jgi:SAM-dependent methyltransferase
VSQIIENIQELLCVNLGCGIIAPANWINCDSSLNAQLARIPILWHAMRKMHLVGDATWANGIRYLQLGRRFPWGSGKVDVVYASHVLEHLDKRTRNNFLTEAHRVLKPTGVIRIVVPDLYYHAKKYVENSTATESGAEAFLHTIHLRLPEEASFLKRVYYLWMGYPHLHKNMYDKYTLKNLMKDYKFIPVGYFSYGRSPNIKNVKDVEFRDEEDGSIYLEATKTVTEGA